MNSNVDDEKADNQPQSATPQTKQPVLDSLLEGVLQAFREYTEKMEQDEAIIRAARKNTRADVKSN